MIVFGTCIGGSGKWEAVTRPALDRVTEPDSRIVTVRGARCIADAYNEILDIASQEHELEAVVLLHDDVEIVSDQFCDVVRGAFMDATVGAAGPIGAANPSSIAWWAGTTTVGSIRYPNGDVGGSGTVGDVDTLDGALIALSPEMARSIRLDANAYTAFHGYDAEICSLVRASGHRILVVDADIIHHTKGGRGDIVAWRRADLTWRSRWTPMPVWKRWVLRTRVRAMRAEVNAARRLRRARGG